jgi:hypothetical protein
MRVYLKTILKLLIFIAKHQSKQLRFPQPVQEFTRGINEMAHYGAAISS